MPITRTSDRDKDKILPHGGYVVSHPTKRMAFHIVPDMSRPYNFADEKSKRNLKMCPTCQTVHLHKTYHILLNDQGRAVVSPGVYKGLLSAKAFSGDDPLKLETHTTKPPDQVLGTRNGMMGLVPQRDKTIIYHE